MTVIDIARLEELDPGGTNTEPTPAPESSSDRGGEWAPRSVTPDNLRAVEAIETLGVVIAETPGISETQIAALTHAIDVLGELAGVATIATETQPIATPTSRRRDTNRDVAVSSSLEVKGREPPPTSMSRPKTSRSSRPCDAVNALVAPLIEKGRREGKPTAITNPQGLVDALASYDDAQITEAVAAFVAEPWTKIDAPLAVFVRRAQIGHDIFITPAPKVEPAGVGERPTLVTDAVHLLDVPEVMPTEVATANLKALAAIRSRNTKTQL